MPKGLVKSSRAGIACLLSVLLLTMFALAIPEAAEKADTGKVDRVELLLNRPRFIYSSLGKRDPFRSLLSGEFRGEGVTGLIDVGDMELVGILRAKKEMLAMVEDSRGRGYVLRVGDTVIDGMVKDITEDSIVIEQTFYGEIQTIVISMKGKEGEDHEK